MEQVGSALCANENGASTRSRRTIGIIAGSGPEAGVDLWSKVLAANRTIMGTAFRGDVDSPPTVIVSEPSLGLSMELARNDEAVWRSLRRAVEAISPQAECFTIACNTLHFYAVRVREIAGDAEFIDVASVVRSHLHHHRVRSVAILGATPVASLGPWSPYSCLADDFTLEPIASLQLLHDLIHDFKRIGYASVDITARFVNFVSELRSDVVVLACTELPLIDVDIPGKTLIDVNMLLAEALARSSHGADIGEWVHIAASEATRGTA